MTRGGVHGLSLGESRLLGNRESHTSDIHFHGEVQLRTLVQFEHARKTRKPLAVTNEGYEGTYTLGH
jgi:hypothetical protein